MNLRTAKDVGALIRQRRLQLGLNQQALAERIGVSRLWIGEVERGKPRAEVGLVLNALHALGLELSALERTGTEPAFAAEEIDLDAIVRRARTPRS